MPGEVAEIALMTEGLRLSEPSGHAADHTAAAIIQRAKHGDTGAFEEIVDCYQRKVMTTAWRMLGNQEDARDASQEVFLRAYRYLGSFKLEQDFGGWLYRIIVNVCRDQARKRGSSQRFASFEGEREAGTFQSLASSEDVEANAIRSQQRALIAEALGTLSTKERMALVLRDLEGLTTEEVADTLGSTQTTVRSQISSARAKIKQYRDRVVKRRG
ncbi:MAG TPA: sigma-70 family RNA polymerase sigma factor [Blastocatellia bacterium]|nr:sigma-70 family RNA polymerase sigma factor [Blastocatellia bacterium]